MKFKKEVQKHVAIFDFLTMFLVVFMASLLCTRSKWAKDSSKPIDKLLLRFYDDFPTLVTHSFLLTPVVTLYCLGLFLLPIDIGKLNPWHDLYDYLLGSGTIDLLKNERWPVTCPGMAAEQSLLNSLRCEGVTLLLLGCQLNFAWPKSKSWSMVLPVFR